MDAVTPKADHSHLVRPAEMEWQKTRFPGCEAKTLLFDRRTGLMTALMRFAPGAVLPPPCNASCFPRVAPGFVPVIAVGVADPAVGLEELVGHLEDREHQAALRAPGDMTAAGLAPDEFAGLAFDALGRAFPRPARAATVMFAKHLRRVRMLPRGETIWEGSFGCFRTS